MKKITVWQCGYCNRYRKSKGSIARHEQICFGNPNRKILEGQLATFKTMPNELKVVDSYGVPNSDWLEPNDYPSKELLDKYKWWPKEKDGSLGLGYIFENGKWIKLSGYVPPRFAPGVCWRDEVIPYT